MTESCHPPCVYVCVFSVTQLCLIFCDPMDYTLPGSFVPGILQARILEQVAICSSGASSQPRNQTQISWPLSISSVQFSHSVVSDSLQPHESQHARPPCPSPTPGVHSYSRPSSRRCHPAISSSVVPFSSFPQSLPALASFPMSQLFA